MSIQPITPPSTFSSCISDSFSINSTALAATTALVAGVALAVFELISWLALASVASAVVVCYLVSRYIQVVAPREPAGPTTATAAMQTLLPRPSTPPPAPIQMTPISTAPTEVLISTPAQTISTMTELLLSDLPQTTPALRQESLSQQLVVRTPLRAAVTTATVTFRDQMLAEVISSPQRIQREADSLEQNDVEEADGTPQTLSAQRAESDDDDSQENSEVSDENASLPRSSAVPKSDEFRTPPPGVNRVLQTAQIFGALANSPAPLSPLATGFQTHGTGGTPEIFNLGVSDSSTGATLRTVLFGSNDDSPPPKPQTPERVKSTRETTTVTQTIVAKYPSPASSTTKPPRHIQQGIEYRRKIVQVYEVHGTLITEILDFDDAHPNAMVPGEEFRQAMRWIAEKKGVLRTQQIEIGRAIDAMKSANLLGPSSRETFVRELNARKIRLDSILKECEKRIQRKKK